MGNRLTGPSERESYEYAEGNMLIKDSVASYEYDTNGNLTKMQGVDWWVAYQYDYENRLTRVTDSNGMDVAYKYDPMGRRIEKNVLGQVTRYFYDAEDIAFEYSGNGTTGNIYIHGPGVDEPLGLRQSKGMYYYHADGLGSIIGITDASARLVQSYEYDSFGNLKDRKNRIKQPYAYTGREYDRETGLYYYRARYYMPEIGRFIQEDPIPAANLYAYVENRPIDFTDPLGMKIYYNGYQVNLTIQLRLQMLSSASGYDIHLLSGTRNNPTDSTTSQHYTGNAADFYLARADGTMIDMTTAAIVTADSGIFGGIGYYDGNGPHGAHIHADARQGDNVLYWSETDNGGYKYNTDSTFWSKYINPEMCRAQ